MKNIKKTKNITTNPSNVHTVLNQFLKKLCKKCLKQGKVNIYDCSKHIKRNENKTN